MNTGGSGPARLGTPVNARIAAITITVLRGITSFSEACTCFWTAMFATMATQAVQREKTFGSDMNDFPNDDLWLLIYFKLLQVIEHWSMIHGVKCSKLLVLFHETSFK